MASQNGGALHIHAFGGPTAVFEVGGLRLVTDPTFDPPGSYLRPDAPTLVKTAPPAAGPEAVGSADAVLLSHDQHADNLDRSGRAYLATVPLTLTTTSGAARLNGNEAAGEASGIWPGASGTVVRGLAPWEHTDLPRPHGVPLRVTAVPARHGPEGCEPISGEVTGFVLTAPDLPTIYLSGDNSWLGAVSQVADRFARVDVAVLYAGAARFPDRFDGALLTLDSTLSAEAARILGARSVVPVHFNSWQHFTEGADDLRKAFAGAGLADRLVLLSPGESVGL